MKYENQMGRDKNIHKTRSDRYEKTDQRPDRFDSGRIAV